MAHPIVHVEIPATDTKAAGKFYADVFGWQVHTEPQFDYTMFSAEGGPGGGFVSTSGQMAAKIGEPLLYIGTDDIEASLRAIEANGGKTVMPKQEIPGVGWFAIFNDPAGNRVALYTEMQQRS